MCLGGGGHLGVPGPGVLALVAAQRSAALGAAALATLRPLCWLVQEAIGLDRHSPYAWCVMGNCFSLQKVREKEGASHGFHPTRPQ